MRIQIEWMNEWLHWYDKFYRDFFIIIINSCNPYSQSIYHSFSCSSTLTHCITWVVPYKMNQGILPALYLRFKYSILWISNMHNGRIRNLECLTYRIHEIWLPNYFDINVEVVYYIGYYLSIVVRKGATHSSEIMKLDSSVSGISKEPHSYQYSI